jgi:nitrogen fixation protein NifU and related proteins
MSASINELYHDLMMDHGRNPRHFGKCGDANRIAEGFNPLCGDKLTLYLKVNTQANIINLIQFEGSGCVISMASASMMSETLQGKTISELQEISQLFHEQLTRDTQLPEKDLHKLGKLSALSSVKNFASRVKCATLAWHTLKHALNQTNTISTTE